MKNIERKFPIIIWETLKWDVWGAIGTDIVDKINTSNDIGENVYNNLRFDSPILISSKTKEHIITQIKNQT